jgi:hypothetical protein
MPDLGRGTLTGHFAETTLRQAKLGSDALSRRSLQPPRIVIRNAKASWQVLLMQWRTR